MRSGAILYEINSPGCHLLSFNFRRWAEVFNLQHTIVSVDEIVDEVINLLQNENIRRSGYMKLALNIINDMTLVYHPPSGLTKIL